MAGIDLAWGEKAGDGVCLVEYRAGRDQRERPCATVLSHAHVHGDEALLEQLRRGEEQAAGNGDRGVFLAVDAPLVCVNEKGRRPVDALASATFRTQHAGC